MSSTPIFGHGLRVERIVIGEPIFWVDFYSYGADPDFCFYRRIAMSVDWRKHTRAHVESYADDLLTRLQHEFKMCFLPLQRGRIKDYLLGLWAKDAYELAARGRFAIGGRI